MPPFLDVSEVLLSPDLADVFTVTRRAETVDNFGVSQQISKNFLRILGVITSAGPNDLERLDDNQRMGRHLVVVTQFRLQGPAPGYQPDTLMWNGDTFVVEAVDPYPQYGAGFIQAIIGSMDSIDQPTENRSQ